MLTLDTLSAYWSTSLIATNLLIALNLMGALVLGLLVGYERSYHGRAAGMRTYGLVCMASAALTVIGGYPADWFGGHALGPVVGDPTRVIQGIVTGIGFLCAGVIMREGFNISGLTTAASLWASSIIGILVGVGFYGAAMLMALLCGISMVWISKLEAWLPSRQAVFVTLAFDPHFVPFEETLQDMTRARGYYIANGSIKIALKAGAYEWSFVAVARSRNNMGPLSDLAMALARFEGINSFNVAYARN